VAYTVGQIYEEVMGRHKALIKDDEYVNVMRDFCISIERHCKVI
jgi:hypothetical protein